MSDTMAGLRRKIDSAGDLQSVVRTMKAVAASNIGQYEKAVRSLEQYYRAVELGLGACLRAGGAAVDLPGREQAAPVQTVTAIVFGSDQGLVGGFNEAIADFAIATLADLPGGRQIWAVGERVQARLADAGWPIAGAFGVPSSVPAISALVGEIQMRSEMHAIQDTESLIYVFHQRPRPGALCEPVSQRLLPLDASWRQSLSAVAWPTRISPEMLCGSLATLRALLREYLFISLYRACAESLASENASRLAAMERADQNIDELLGALNGTFHQLRQNSIDEELFDVIAGFEALTFPSKA